MRPADVYPKARAAALEALKIDDALVEARVALSGVHQCFDFDLKEAERELRDAIALQPDYAVAHRRYAILLDTQRRFDAALVEIRRAEELEPFSSMNYDIAAGILLNAGRADEAAEESRKAAALEPGEVEEGKRSPALAAGTGGRGHRGVRKGRQGRSRRAPGARSLGRSRVLLRRGRPEEGRRADPSTHGPALRAALRSREPRAVVYAGLGDRDLAFEWLDRGLADREAIGYVNSDPRFASLRTDPRFPQVLRRLGLS